MKIYKYRLNIDAETEIKMPSNAKVLSVQNQKGDLCLWALVYDVCDMETRKFYVAGTGHSLPPGIEKWKYLDTVQFYAGDLVMHVFMENE
jgi:hypothetical protein